MKTRMLSHTSKSKTNNVGECQSRDDDLDEDNTVDSPNRGSRVVKDREWDSFTLQESMVELKELCMTAGFQVVGYMTQTLHKKNSRTCIGSGKVK